MNTPTHEQVMTIARGFAQGVMEGSALISKLPLAERAVIEDSLVRAYMMGGRQALRPLEQWANRTDPHDLGSSQILV